MQKSAVRNIVKLDILALILMNIEVLQHIVGNLKHSILKEMTVIFYNGSIYDYRVIINKLSRRV